MTRARTIRPRRRGLLAWRRGRDLAILLLAGNVAGCGGAPEAVPLTVAPTAPNVTPSVAPTILPSPSPEPTLGPTPSEVPEPTLGPLPEAAVHFAGGDVPGTLGTFTLVDTGSDAPWLPFDMLPAVTTPPDGTLAIGFVDGNQIGAWSARIATAEDRTGSDVTGIDGRLDGPPVDSVEVGPLPAGRWVLGVYLTRADGTGAGITYWAVTVP